MITAADIYRYFIYLFGILNKDSHGLLEVLTSTVIEETLDIRVGSTWYVMLIIP